MFGILIVFFYCITSAYGHGYLLEPVARSSAWLVDPSFKQCCTWPQHNEMFCGGIGHQWNINDGKCSICGEAYDKPVKLFEKGGTMYKGTIVQKYTQGQQIEVKVVLSANHKGYFEFRLCNLDASPLADATQECLDHNLLKIADTDSTKFSDVGKYGSTTINIRVQLPPNVACQHCVFQWKYTAGNNWGTDPITGQSGGGLGRENETFMGCSDIAILHTGSPTEPPMVIIPTTPTITTTSITTGTNTNNAQVTTSSNQWTWPSSSSQGSVPTTTYHWTWPTLSSQESVTPMTTSTFRAPLGLTTWSSELFEYQIGDEVMYDDIKYRCVAPHRSFPGAEPGVLTWAWWQRVEEES
ncbi:unnamed protein product [Adineta steineri]|uniref:Chitin-binding type-4 domain-containing protein n=1 Tax=Adineta steineri TaxID=433720 RepID=A0A813V211_9BILA|nr:unnamed protein product [Adineta steineri]CAF0976925.1 unnamed protein product [Adineta steineri]